MAGLLPVSDPSVVPYPSPAAGPSAAWAAPDSAVDQPARATGLLDLGGGGGGSGSAPDATAGRHAGPARRAAAPPRLPVPLRPMTILDKLDGSFAIMKARPTRVIGITAIIMIPAHLLQAFVIRNNAGVVEVIEALNRPSSSSSLDTGGDLLSALIGAMVAAFSYLLLGAALTPLVTGWYLGEDPTVGDALRQVVRRSPQLVASFVLLLPVKAFCILCYLPALFFVPVFILTAPVMMAEGAGPLAGPKRSWTLTMRRFGSVLLTWLGTAVVELAVGQVLLVLVQLLGQLTPDGSRWLVVGTGSALVSLVVAPFVVGVVILQYLDLRIRTEGFDVVLDADRVLPDVGAVAS